MALTDRQTAERIAVEADLLQAFRRFPAQVLEGRALLDAEQGLVRPLAEGRLAALAPAGRQAQGLGRAVMGGGPGDAFVQLHDDVGPQQVRLDLDGPLR